jgi:putative transposase
MDYRRVFLPGGTYFFTVVTCSRQPIFSNRNAVKVFKEGLQKVNKAHPFIVDAIVILPDHIHTIWTLPENDSDYPTRWRLIKSYFSRLWTEEISTTMEKPASRDKKNEKTIWQRRFWEHTIIGEEDFNRHRDYIYYNPVLHGHVNDPIDWEYLFIKNDHHEDTIP